jgi:hypothetical protein
MNEATLFSHLRRAPFGGRMTQSQIDGVKAIIEACERHGVTDIEHVAHVLAHVKRETGGYMLGIKETVMPSHKDKNPPDAVVIARLDKAFADGKLKGVRTPYWRGGAFGRGPIQITHWDNYVKFGKVLGVPLRANPELALDRNIGADIAVIGMKEGLFRNRKLSDYQFPDALDAPPSRNPRRIVNGNDGSDAEVAASHRAFALALHAAANGTEAARPAPEPKPRPRPTPRPKPAASAPDAIAAEPEPAAVPDRPWWEKSPVIRSLTQLGAWIAAGGSALLAVDWKVIAVLSIVGAAVAMYAIRYQTKAVK